MVTLTKTENVWQSGYAAGHDTGFEKGKLQSYGAVWIKGQYDQLYNLVKASKRVACCVDYKPWHSESTFRDICTIGKSMEFVSRGHGYGRVDDGEYTGTELERFIQMCTELNVEWVNEAGSAETKKLEENPKENPGAHMRCEG